MLFSGLRALMGPTHKEADDKTPDARKHKQKDEEEEEGELH